MTTIALLATGGTIAGAAASATDTQGYAAGSLGAQSLLDAVPDLRTIAQFRSEQVFNMDSKDMGPPHWLTLAARVRAHAADPAIDAILITHGTDTMEETAFFLDAVADTDKPVVLTGAMRPATALSADGPMNLLDAAGVCATPASRGRGVLQVFGKTVFRAGTLRKSHTDRLDAFDGEICARIEGTTPRFLAPAPVRHASAAALPATLPRVDILYPAAGAAPDLVDAVIALGAKGIVLALPGNGSLAAGWESAVTQAVAQGIPVVRASRCGHGPVSALAVDARCGSRAAGPLSPAAARVALMLELAGVRPLQSA